MLLLLYCCSLWQWVKRYIIAEVINKFIQYPGEFICILRKAFEFHNEELLKDKDQYYLKGFQRKSNQKKAVRDGAELKITFYANQDE